MSSQRPDIAQPLGGLVRRVLADNPSAYTYTGTQTYLIGRGEVAVIDPGPDLPSHVDGILSATRGERITRILCTHTHRDHSPAAAMLAQATGAEIVGCAPLVLIDDGPRSDDSFDTSYAPDRILTDGATVDGDGWTITAIATPGHTSNHLCYALEQDKVLFSGDHVMGWSTTVIVPPDGDMAAYLASLDKLTTRDDRRYHPAHGEAIETPQRFVRGLIGHRKSREGQIRRLLEEAPHTVPAMVERMYVGLDPKLIGAAQRSVLAHLIDLEHRGEVWRQDPEWLLA